MEAGDGRCEAFVVAGEATEASTPSKGTLDDPATWQEHEAAFGFLEFDHLQADALLSGGGDLGARISLIDKGHGDALAGDGLKLLAR